MVVVATTPPVEFVARRELVIPESAKLVAVALVRMEFVARKLVEKRFVEVAFVEVEKVDESEEMVEDALEMRPVEKIMREVVALCPAAGCVQAS